jgi:hypothetical protein
MPSMDTWFNHTFEHGDLAHCQGCGKKIYFCQLLDGGSKEFRGMWLSEKYPHRVSYDMVWDRNGDFYKMANAGDHYHLPKEFCIMHRASEYSRCGKPVKWEDQVAEIYACGHHRAKALEEHKAEQRRKQADLKRQKDEEVAEYEREFYKQAVFWLRENGFEELLSGYDPYDRYYKSVVKRDHKVDVFKLYEAVRKIREEDDDGEVQSGEDDPWREHAGEVQVHP